MSSSGRKLTVRSEFTAVIAAVRVRVSTADCEPDVRTSGSQSAVLTRTLTAAITAVNSDLTVSFRPLDDIVDAALTQERLIAMLSGFFGVLALLLAALGLYGVTAYSVIR